MKPMIFLYGPPGSGKTTTGRLLAESLEQPFYDLDEMIEAKAGKPIAAIFAAEGEAHFRQVESDCLKRVIAHHQGVVALGGGALMDEINRRNVEEAGQVVCLMAAHNHLLERVHSKPGLRPLLGNVVEVETRLANLLEQRSRHYASFSQLVDTSQISPPEAAWQVQVKAGVFHVHGMGQAYDVRVQAGGLGQLGEYMAQRSLKGPVVVVSDEHVAPLYGTRALTSLEKAGYSASLAVIPSGEAHKTIETVASLWKSFLSAGVERTSTVVALGGGVVGDLAGFAAATYLRGVAWVGVPTSLLAMADSSLGGKTGADLPQGKNLIGAFHSPSLVLADPNLLASLPEVELRNGLAEVVKHGLLADPGLFERCATGWRSISQDWESLVRQAMAVKIQFIEADPYERGRRAALNLGHTVGHAVETVSHYRLRHGEAVSIGLVLEARLAERMGLAQFGLTELIRATLENLGLPVCIPADLDRTQLVNALQVDKKKAGGSVRFALPVAIGQVETGVVVSGEDIQWILES